MTYNVQNLVKKLNLEVITGSADALKRPIHIPEVSRPSLEIAGFLQYHQPKRILVLGKKETAFLANLSPSVKRKRYKSLLLEQTPAIVFAHGNLPDEQLIRMAKKINFPILVSNKATVRVIFDIMNEVFDALAPKTTLIGCLINIQGRGVLIKGKSGIGKSEVSLELVRRGHSLVADDRVDSTLKDGKVIGFAPQLLKNMIEIRGIGILDITKLFGITSVLSESQIDYIIDLVVWDDHHEFERIGSSQHYDTILGVKLPLVTLPVSQGRNLADVIEIAVLDLKLKESGYNCAHEFEKKYTKLLEEEK